MADIDIEKKKNSIWPWILGILALLAIIFIAWWALDDDDDDDVDMATVESVEGTESDMITTTTGAASIQSVDDYITWTQNIEAGDMGVEHTFTKNGLLNLATALKDVANDAPDVNKAQFDAKLTKMRAMADSITDEWKETTHANKIKRAFAASVDVMQELQQSSFPDLQSDVSNLQQEVSQMDPSVMTLEQKEEVKSFFRESADILQKMENNISG